MADVIEEVKVVIKKAKRDVKEFGLWWDEVGKFITPEDGEYNAEHLQIVSLLAYREALSSKWNHANEKPEFDYKNFQNRVLVKSSYGTRCAWYCTIDQCYQDCETGVDEDHMNEKNIKFEVYRWQYLPE